MKPKTANATAEVTSLRDYFAAKAMQTLLSTPLADWPFTLAEDVDGSVSKAAFLMADHMLKERAKWTWK